MAMIEFVRIAVLVLLAVVVLAAADLVVGTWWRRRRWFRRHRAEHDVMVAVVDALGDPDLVPQARDALRAADPVVARTVCLAVGRVVASEERTVLARLASTAGVDRRARRDLRSRRWWRRLRAVRLLHLASAGPADRAVLDDPHPEVRAAALIWLADRPAQLAASTARSGPEVGSRVGGPSVAELLARALVSDAALVRLAAKHVCVRAQPPPIGVLGRALDLARGPDTSPLAPVAPLATIAALGGSVPLDFDEFLVADAAAVRAAAVRAIAATSPEQIAFLAQRYLDDEQVVRMAVADVAGRDPAACPLLVELSRDPSWQVRQVARRSLRRAGPVGRALLRRLQQVT